MANYKYTYQKFEPKEMVRVLGRGLPISTKTSMEIAAFIKGKQIDKAMQLLEQVVTGKVAIPFKKHVKDIPHRKGMRTGRFPKNASEHVIKLLKGLKSNAQNQGFDTSKMIIVHTVAQKGPIIFHTGRQRLKRKNSHFEIIAKRVEKLKEKKKRKVQPKAALPAVEKKPVKKEVPKKPETIPKEEKKKLEEKKTQPEIKKAKAISAAPHSKGASE